MFHLLDKLAYAIFNILFFLCGIISLAVLLPFVSLIYLIDFIAPEKKR